jgi:GntR family transcriptional regulator/MocR family aminotransferase
MERFIEWSARYGFGLLEDDWGSDMLSFSEFRPSLRARAGDNVLYVNSFTKKLLPSMRLGYLVGNEQVTPALVQAKHNTALGTPLIIEAALCEFLDLGYYDAHLKQLHPELDRRYHACLEVLLQTMPEPVRWTSSGGGPMLWIEIPQHINIEELSENLAERGVFILISTPAFSDPPHLHDFRLCHAAIKSEAMQRGIEILADDINRLL